MRGLLGEERLNLKLSNEAKLLLENKSLQTSFFEWNLKKDVGMSCGGVVRIIF